MPYNYQYTNLRALVRDFSGQNSQSLGDERAMINHAVRTVGTEVDLRSAKRRAVLAPRLTSEYDYTAPANMKGWGIIDVHTRVKRKTRQGSEWQLTTVEEFERLKTVYDNLIALTEFDGTKVMKLSSVVDDDKLEIHNMDGVTSNGTWATDSDNTASNDLDTSTSEDFTGSAHLVWDVDTTGTSAILQNSTMSQFNFLPFKRDRGYIYLKQYIPVTSATERAKITSFRLQFGSDSSNYYEDTQTTAANGLAFVEGLNTLRFNVRQAATAGTPVDTAMDYVRLGVVLSSAFVSEEQGWRTDEIVARQGGVHEVLYYTNFLWDCGALRVSAGDTDFLSACEEEMNLFALKGRELVFRSMPDRSEEAREAKRDYDDAKKQYQLDFPSEAKVLSTYYHYLGDATEDGRGALPEESTPIST